MLDCCAYPAGQSSQGRLTFAPAGLALAFLLRGGQDGGAWLYLATAATGAGMAA